MVQVVTGVNEIAQLKDCRQTAEQRLAADLIAVFGSREPLTKLRAMVRRALFRVLPQIRRFPPMDYLPWPIADALEEERFLGVLQKLPRQVRETGDSTEIFEGLIERVNDFTVHDISDVIRLVGACNEKVAERQEMEGNIPDLAQHSYRGGLGLEPVVSAAEGWAAAAAIAEAGAVWSQRGPLPARARARLADANMAIPLPGNIRGPENAAGMHHKRAYRTSELLKVNRAFGLLTGADISGTTADSTFFIERWAEGELPPAYYLLPAGTIVYNNHHTLIEVALVLSLNRIMEYDIWDLGSLLPAAWGRLPDELQGIEAAVVAANADIAKCRFLLFYDAAPPYPDEREEPERPPQGAVVLSETEAAQFMATGNTRASLMHRIARGWSPYPGFDNICGLLPPDLAAASQASRPSQ